MPTSPNTPHRDEQRDIRLYLLLLSVVVILLVVVAAMVLVHEHPSLEAPFAAGGTIAAALVAVVAVIYQRR